LTLGGRFEIGGGRWRDGVGGEQHLSAALVDEHLARRDQLVLPFAAAAANQNANDRCGAEPEIGVVV
jgi:hypothetical protein